MYITDEKVTEYINNYYMPINRKLDTLRKKCEEDNIPLILRETESFLQILIRMKKPSKILEIGTAYGYSASFFASITTNAEIHTIEKDNELYKIARENIKQIGVNDRVKCILGDALTVLDELRYPRCDNMDHYKYDMVFIDGAKSRYREIFDKSIELCDKNALIICDNVLLKGSNMQRLLIGLWTSLRISLIAVVISIFLGLIVGVLMTRKNIILKVFTRVYLEIVRIMPQLVLLFIVFFGATRVFGIDIEAEKASIIVFSFWGTAEMADLVRGALISIPKHQYESAKALGMSELQIYLHIVMPQTLRRLIPLSMNLITRMIKTTSLIMMIGVVEVLKVGQQIIEANRTSSPNAAFGVFAAVFVLYFIACWPISMFSKYLERKWV